MVKRKYKIGDKIKHNGQTFEVVGIGLYHKLMDQAFGEGAGAKYKSDRAIHYLLNNKSHVAFVNAGYTDSLRGN